jgi:hypothetical protein
MALNFPNSPSLNQIYTDNTSGFSYQWNGTVWISFTPSSSSQIKTLDDFSASFNNSTQTFSLTSGGSAVTPPTPQSLIINLGGVIQDPTDDYSVAGSNITFSTPPANGLSFSGVALGPAVPINTIPDGTVTDGSLRISTKAVVGAATTFTEDLVVNGSARVVGVLTVGTSSITLNGITNVINVGTGLTLSSSGIVAGIVTATQLSLNGQSLVSGIGINTAGGSVGTGATVLDFRGSGISTVTVSSGIATVNILNEVTLTGTQTLTNKTLTDPAITGTILEDVFTITDGAAFEVDPGNGSIQLITLGASRTPKATNFAAGESITLMVDDGSAYTLTWTDATWGGSGVEWTGGAAPDLATSGYTVLQFWKVSTQVYGAFVGEVA